MKFYSVSKKKPNYGKEVVLWDAKNKELDFGNLSHTDGEGDHYSVQKDGSEYEVRPTHWANKEELPTEKEVG